MNVLWLASWYPSRLDAFNGDFIMRHAKATAPFVNSLTVIAAIKDESLQAGSSQIECSVEGNITTYIIYYGRSIWPESIERFFSIRQFLSLHRKLFSKIVEETGKPDMVHVHIAMKAGLFAREIKKKYNIPYIITEQWTGYFKNAQSNIFGKGFLFMKLTKAVLKDASLLLPVSSHLGNIINSDIETVKFTCVPNVVDTSIFYPVLHSTNDLLQLVHVSIMGYQKNAEAMIEALSIYKSRGGKFVLQIFGPPPAHLIALVQQKKLEGEIIFKGEVTQDILAPAIQAADALILYSRYETFGCVLIEANACGVPVIVSKFPVFDEFITEGKNGVFAEGDNPEALAKAIGNFNNNRKIFNKEEIAAEAKMKFSYNTVGKMISDIYKKYALR